MKTKYERLYKRLEKVMRYLRIDQMERENEIKKIRQKMWKQTLFGCLMFVCLISAADDVSLAWDESEGATSYVLYGSSLGLEGIRLNAGTNTSATVTNPLAGEWTFGVVAVGDDGSESEMSNLVIIQSTNAVAAVRKVIIQRGPKRGGIGF